MKKDYGKIEVINEDTSAKLKESVQRLKKEKIEKENLMEAFRQLEEDFLNNAKSSVFTEDTEKERLATNRLVLQLKSDLVEYEDELR